MLQGAKIYLWQVLVFLGLPTGLVLLGASAIWERQGLLGSGLALMAAKPARYAAAILMGFLVNLSTAFAIKVTGSLTFKASKRSSSCLNQNVAVSYPMERTCYGCEQDALLACLRGAHHCLADQGDRY